jgi:hypothetical protein
LGPRGELVLAERRKKSWTTLLYGINGDTGTSPWNDKVKKQNINIYAVTVLIYELCNMLRYYWAGGLGLHLGQFMVDVHFFEIFGFPLSVSLHYGSPYSCIIGGMNKRPIGGRILLVQPHHIDMT